MRGRNSIASSTWGALRLCVLELFWSWTFSLVRHRNRSRRVRPNFGRREKRWGPELVLDYEMIEELLEWESNVLLRMAV